MSYTNALKARQLGIPETDPKMRSYEEDHRMPLELGGSPRDEHNLSPELGIPNPKDQEENQLHDAVCCKIQHRCRQAMKLYDAQARLIADWLDTWPNYKQ